MPKQYLFEYRHEDGRTYGFQVPADSVAEAKARVKSMVWAQYKGEIALTIYVPTGSFFRRIIRWFRASREGGE